MRKARVVIIGGGFGGAFTARYLRRYAPRDWDIELINSTNYFVFQPLLPEVASGTISAPDAVMPLRHMLPGVKVRMADVVGVDRRNQEVNFLQGSKRFPLTARYDHLVIAVGQKTNLTRTPGFREHSFCMRDLADAHVLRNHVIQCLEHADVTDDPELKRRLLTFVVAGGGFSGVETIGEMLEMIHRTLKFYPNVVAEDIRAVLVQRGQRILPELSPRLSTYAQRKLAGRSVRIMVGASIQSATATAVYLQDGSRINTHTLITTVGNGPRPVAESLGIELIRGKIPVDKYLRVAETDRIWCIGDAALIPIGQSDDGERDYAPPTAQFAVREARCVAKNIIAVQMQESPIAFRYKPRGTLASIGNYKAVADIFGVRLSGLPAWLLWRSFYISMLPGFSTRLRVALNWLFDYFLPRSIVQISSHHQPATSYRCYARGDVVCRPGQIVDGLYTVVSGYLESRIPNPATGEDFVRLIGEGDHWGERSLTGRFETQGTLTAVEDTRVLVLGEEEFRNLRTTFPPLDDYFRHVGEKIYAPALRQAPSRTSEKRPP